MRSLIRAFASGLNILCLATDRTSFVVSMLKRNLHRFVLSLHLSKCLIVGNLISRLKCDLPAVYDGGGLQTHGPSVSSQALYH